MFQKLIHFFTGRISFAADNGFETLFINTCKREGAELTDIIFTENGITASTRFRNYEILMRAAQESGMELRDIKKYGLPSILRRYKARLGIPVGLLISAAILLLLSNMLWSIEVTGLKTINEHAFLSYLEEENVKPGIFLMNVNCREIASVTEHYGKNILRASVNLIGCKLFIDIEERTPPPQINAENRYCNIIAAKDGEILKADVFAGEARIKTGDAVCKGDILVGGTRETAEGEHRFLEAKAQILARTRTFISCQTAFLINVESINAVKDRYTVSFFGVQLPHKTEEIASGGYLSSATGGFPIGILRSRETQFTTDVKELNLQESFLISVTDLAAKAFLALKSKKVVSQSISIEKGDQLCVDAQFYCEEDIALPQYFEAIIY